MLSLLRGSVGEAAAPVIFLVLFLVIVGGALWVTPRLAKWLDRREAGSRGYFDGMLEEDPAKKADRSADTEEDSHV